MLNYVHIVTSDFYEIGREKSSCRAALPPSKVESIPQLVTTRTDIKLWPSNYVDGNITTSNLLKQLVRTRSDINLRPSG